jgi:hypothetical protein
METTADPTVMRLTKRIDLFKRCGLDEEPALHFATALCERDADLDDRSMCIECAHLQRDGGCFAARQGWIQGASVYLTPVKTMLQRCERFESQGV